MLTKKQKELLLFIDSYLETRGIAPSFEEMKEAVNLKSKSGIHRLVKALEGARIPATVAASGTGRWKVLRPPPSRAASAVPERQPNRRFRPSVIKGDFRSGRGTERPSDDRGERGAALSMAASPPARPSRRCATRPTTPMSPARCWGPASITRLEVDGDSMIEAGILDGDTAVIERCDTAENGAIVVASLVDDSEGDAQAAQAQGRVDRAGAREQAP